MQYINTEEIVIHDWAPTGNANDIPVNLDNFHN